MEGVPAAPVLVKEARGRRREWTEGGVRLRCRHIGALANPVCSPGQAPQSCPAPALGDGLGEGGDGVSWGGRWGGPSPPEPRPESAVPPAAGSKPLLPADVGGTSSLQCRHGTRADPLHKGHSELLEAELSSQPRRARWVSLLAFLPLRLPFSPWKWGAGGSERSGAVMCKPGFTLLLLCTQGPRIKGRLRHCLRFLRHHHAQHLVCVSPTTNLGN